MLMVSPLVPEVCPSLLSVSVFFMLGWLLF